MFKKVLLMSFLVSAIAMYSTLVFLPSKHLIAYLDESPLRLIAYLDAKNLKRPQGT